MGIDGPEDPSPPPDLRKGLKSTALMVTGSGDRGTEIRAVSWRSCLQPRLWQERGQEQAGSTGCLRAPWRGVLSVLGESEDFAGRRRQRAHPVPTEAGSEPAVCMCVHLCTRV